MKRLLALLLFAIPTLAQTGNQSLTGGASGVTSFAGAPTGGCTATQQAVDTTTGNTYSCNGGAWLKIGPGAGGGAPTGAATGDLGGTYPSPTLLPSVGVSKTILSGSSVLAVVHYLVSAGTPSWIEIYPNAGAKPDEGAAATQGTVAWATAQLTSGGVIQVHQGAYTVATTITLSTAGTQLTCDDPGSVTFTAGAAFNSIMFKMGWTGAQVQGLAISNCGFNGNNGGNTSGTTIYMRDVANSRVEKNYIKFSKINGLVLDATISGIVQNYVTDNFFVECGQECLVLNGAASNATDSVIERNQIGGSVTGDSTKPWVTVNGLGSLQFANNHLSGTLHTSCMVFTNASQTDVEITGNEFENCPQHGLVLAGLQQTVTGNLFYNNGTASVGVYSDIYLQAAQSITITANIFRGQSTTRRGVFSDQGTVYNTINGNIFTGLTGNAIDIASAFSGGNTIGANQYSNNVGSNVVEAATHFYGNNVSMFSPAGLAQIPGQLKANGLSTAQLVAGTSPTITTGGTGGAATWTYVIVPQDINGNHAPASTGGSTSVGNATLTGVNFNIISWTLTPGASSYDIYRTVVGTSPTTLGKIGNVLSTAPVNVGNGTFFFNDTGLPGDTTTAPAVNSTGSATFAGAVSIPNGTSITAPGLFFANSSTSGFFNNGGNINFNGASAIVFNVGGNGQFVMDGTILRDNSSSSSWNRASGLITVKALASATNCLAAGTAVAASAVACGSAVAGMFSIPITTPTSAVVTTTALTANSEIIIQQRLDSTAGAGAALAVTCNTTKSVITPEIVTRTATSFTINLTAFTTNPGCYQYMIIN